MTAREERRTADRIRANAAAGQVPPSEWAAMPRRERRRRLRHARKVAGRG